MENCTASIKAEDTKNLEVSFNCAPSDAINSEIALGESFDPQIGNTEMSAQPEMATAPASSNFDLKTGGIIGLLTLIGSSPILVELLKGIPLAEVLSGAMDLIKTNIVLIGIISVVYLLRETIHGAFKQWIFAKVIDTKADPNKNSVEIKPQ